MQNLHYTYDPAGNITHIRDDAQQTIYFRNQRVEPSADYTYDAIYRLIEATGREHLGQVGGAADPALRTTTRRASALLVTPATATRWARYVERYVYDAVGNFLEMQHRGTDPAHPGWTRAYAYDEASLIEPGKHEQPPEPARPIGGNAETYSRVERTATTPTATCCACRTCRSMQWDFQDQLQMTQRQAVNATDATACSGRASAPGTSTTPAGSACAR